MIKNKIAVIVCLLITLWIPSLVAAESLAKLEDFGGAGTRIYWGRDFRSMFLSACQVIIMGTEKTPVVLISLKDASNVYSFWTHSPTFKTSSQNEWLASANDKMEIVPESLDGNRKIYTNLSENESEGFAEIHVYKDQTGTISQVDLEHTIGGKLDNRVSCRNLH